MSVNAVANESRFTRFQMSADNFRKALALTADYGADRPSGIEFFKYELRRIVDSED